MLKVRYNKRSTTAKIQKALDLMEEEVKGKLKKIANDLATRTLEFTDTGAYAESFSVTDAGGRAARRVSSTGRPKNQSREQYRNIALSQMLSDIENLQILEGAKPIFKNSAPHAPWVEDKYLVFQSVRNNNR